MDEPKEQQEVDGLCIMLEGMPPILDFLLFTFFGRHEERVFIWELFDSFLVGVNILLTCNRGFGVDDPGYITEWQCTA